MRKHSHKSSGKNLKGLHPGSSAEDARRVGEALPKSSKIHEPPAPTTPPALTEFWPRWKFYLLREPLTEG